MTPIIPITTTMPTRQNIYKNFAPIPAVLNNSALIGDEVEKDFPWIKEKNILLALNELKQINFNSQDIQELEKIGVVIPFVSGADAVNFLKQSNTRIVFDEMAKDVHAQYDFSKNFIKINKMYKNTLNTAEILAIAESILHEAGHAKDMDNQSSLQEEINFLGTNALAHRDLQRRYPDMFKNSDAPIVNDGVSIYEKLFFDKDPNKAALVKRLQVKYGYLPAGDSKHPPSPLAIKAKGLYF